MGILPCQKERTVAQTNAALGGAYRNSQIWSIGRGWRDVPEWSCPTGVRGHSRHVCFAAPRTKAFSPPTPPSITPPRLGSQLKGASGPSPLGWSQCGSASGVGRVPQLAPGLCWGCVLPFTRQVGFVVAFNCFNHNI